MFIEFDPDKDAINIRKHGISLARAAELRSVATVRDMRFAEERYRSYGLLDGETYCLAFTPRGAAVRAISLRRAHDKEYKRHVG